MRLRTFNVLSLASLCALTAAAGYTAGLLEEAADQIAMSQEQAELPDCMAVSIETGQGAVGCFQPVIAIVDETFFLMEETSDTNDIQD